MEVRRAQLEDVSRVVALMNSEDENMVNADQLTNWYFNNHSQSHGLIICESDNEVEGICSTNHFKFDLDGVPSLIAFPMKVLTSSKIRGKGMFSKLYWKNEEVCFKEEAVDFFINFPNDVSSPIFLKKFDYLEGVCSDLALILSSPLNFSKSSSYKKIDQIPKSFFKAKHFTKSNGFSKDYNYYHWRYETPVSTESEKYKFIQLGDDSGMAILKKDKKKGLPIFLLLDVIVRSSSDTSKVIKASRRYALQNGAIGILSFVNDYNKDIISKIKLKRIIKNQFNFSVKGKSEEQTKILAKKSFNFELGDLDFL